MAERDARPDASALCASCGGTLHPQWLFCGHCRAPVARTSTQPSRYRPSAVTTFAEPAESPLTPCPSCRQPMEEGGDFCEHCGARASAVARPAPAAYQVGDAVGRPPLDAPSLHPPAGTSTEEYEEDDEDDYAPDAFVGEAYNDGGAALEDDSVEAAPYDEEALDDQGTAFDEEEDEEYEEGAYEEDAADAVGAQVGANAAIYEEATPPADSRSSRIQSAPPRTSPYGEPRSFAYNQPLPTFGLDEEAERREAPAGGAGRKWIVIGGAGLAALLFVVAVAVLFRQTPTPDTMPPSSGAAAKVEDTPATAQPAPPEGMVYVPGGKFFMGRDGGDDYERPRHEVAVTPFFIDKYEVTREEYQKFVEATGRAPSGWVGRKFSEGTGRWPVTGVNWADAVAYAQWAGKRLPTEAEWEYAARGADGRLYPWGNEWQAGLANADSSTRKGMAPVGEFKGASPFGIFDMVGNAWEWTSSKLEAYPGGRLPKHELGDLRVIRGGSWDSDSSSATTTYRWGWIAEGAEDYSNTSFRCVKDTAANQR